MNFFLPLQSALQKKNFFPLDRIEAAYSFAEKFHRESGQMRKTGEPYIIHPVAVAEILLELGADEETLIAALLHDTVEDTTATIEIIEEQFGKKVAFLVDGVTKLQKDFREGIKSNHEEKTLQKLFSSISQDPRIILIKLADRIHNMRTLSGLRPEKQARKAQETLDFYMPLAQMGNLWNIKREMEDICFRVFSPKEHELLRKIADQAQKKEQESILELKKNLFEKMQAGGAEGNIFVENLLPAEIKASLDREGANNYHVFQILICVQKREEAYRCLGIVNALFHSVHGSVRDYISVPKKNGYRAIHTMVIFEGKRCLFRVQEKDDCELNGKQCSFLSSDAETKESMMNILPEMIKKSRTTASFIYNLKNHALAETVSVHDHHGNTFRLPKGASLIDAYFFGKWKIDDACEEIPQHALLNGERVLTRVALHENDVFHFLEDSPMMKASPLLLRYIKTTDARFFLTEFLRKGSEEQVQEWGKEYLLDELKRMGFLSGSSSEEASPLFSDFSSLGRGEGKMEDILPFFFQKEGAEEHSDFLELTVFNDKSRVGFVQSILRVLEERNMNITEIQGHAPDSEEDSGFVRLSIEIFEYKKDTLFDTLIPLANAIEQVDGVSQVAFHFFAERKRKD